MNNFYHKIAVASVGIALGFALGTHKEAKAATFILTRTNSYHLSDQDGLLYSGDNTSLRVGTRYPRETEEYRAFYEFNIANLFLDSNTVISSAILVAKVFHIGWYRPHSQLEAYGYTENEKVDPLGVYNAGEYLDQLSLYSDNFHDLSFTLLEQIALIYIYDSLAISGGKRYATFNVLPFINQRIESNNSFAGFGLRFFNREGFVALNPRIHLIITTAKVAEPVPEPTTIFGSAIGLCLGGWLKRKKSTLPNKITSQG